MPRQIPVRLPDELAARAEAIAKERGITISAFIREAIRDHIEFDRRQAQADSLEARLVATLGRTNKDLNVVRNDLHVVMAYCDSLVRSFLLHTPPVPTEAVPAAAASADARYNRFMTNVAKALQGQTGMFDRVADLSADAVEALAPDVDD